MCRSESLPPPAAYSTWVLGGLLLAILLVSGGVLAYRIVHGVARAAIVREAARPPPPADVERAVAVAPADAAVAAAPIVGGNMRAAGGESIPLAEVLAEALPQPAVPAAAPPEPVAPIPVAVAPPSRPAPTPAELQAALSATPVVMYSASWCGVCRKAKRFLSDNGLRYQEIDADTTPGGWEKVEQLIGRRAVPVIIVDGELAAAGLSPTSIMHAVSLSMERRLGVRGIQFELN